MSSLPGSQPKGEKGKSGKFTSVDINSLYKVCIRSFCQSSLER